MVPKAAPIFSRRTWTSLVSFNKIFIYITGGSDVLKNGKFGTSKKVYQYAIGSDTWTEAAPLNRGRKNHSSCVLGDSIYVCGGINRVRKYRESIEKLTVFASAPRDKSSSTCWSSSWEVLKIKTPKIKSFLMVPISVSEILFLGGER